MAEMSAAMREFARRAGTGRLEMQKCAVCGAVQWPPRDVCGACWANALAWSEISPAGVLVAATTLHFSMERFFVERLPWRVGTVRLEAGPVAYAHLHRAIAEGEAIRIESHRDCKGRGVLVAFPAADAGEDKNLSDLISTREE